MAIKLLIRECLLIFIKKNQLKKYQNYPKKIKFVQETEISSITLTLGSWSASTSPARSPPSPRSRFPGSSSTHRSSRRNHLNFKAYGTTSLMQRSRSPSPARLQEMRESRERYYRNEMGTNMILTSKKKILSKTRKNFFT